MPRFILNGVGFPFCRACRFHAGLPKAHVESAPAVLAFAVSFRDGLDGREPGRTIADGGLWRCPSAGRYRVGAQQGHGSLLASAVGRDWKGKLSPAIYLAVIASAEMELSD
jgi:hypothetical protein